jgi:hypothetical protein
MNAKDPPVTGAVNDPMMPIARTKTYTGSTGKSAWVLQDGFVRAAL